MLSTSGVNPMVFTSGSRPHHDEALVEEMFAHGLRVGSCALRLWRPVENRRHFDLVVSGDMKKFNDFQSLSKEQLMLNVLSQILQCLALALSFFPDNVQLEKKSWHSGTKIMGFFYGFTMVSLWFLGSSTLASRQAQGIQGLRAKPGVRKRSPKSTVGTSRCGLGRPISMGKSHLKWIITMDNFMDNMTILWIMTRRMVYSEQFQSKMDGLEGTIPV